MSHKITIAGKTREVRFSLMAVARMEKWSGKLLSKFRQNIGLNDVATMIAAGLVHVLPNVTPDWVLGQSNLGDIAAQATVAGEALKEFLEQYSKANKSSVAFAPFDVTRGDSDEH